MSWRKLPTGEENNFIPGELVVLSKLLDNALLYAAPGIPTRRDGQLKLNFSVGKLSESDVAIVVSTTSTSKVERSTAIMTSKGLLGWISPALLRKF